MKRILFIVFGLVIISSVTMAFEPYWSTKVMLGLRGQIGKAGHFIHTVFVDQTYTGGTPPTGTGRMFVDGKVAKFIDSDGVTSSMIAGAGGGDPDQNLWETITSDSGSAVANIVTDTLTIAGGTNCNTSVSGDTLTIDVTGGAGDVSKVGTPVDNQVGVWTGDGTIEGTSALTFDGLLAITSGSAGLINLNPSNTGNQSVIDITPSAALVAGSVWSGLKIDGNALDPLTGATSDIHALNVDFSSFASADGNAELHIVHFDYPASDSSTGLHSEFAELTNNSTVRNVFTDMGSLVLSATATYIGHEIDMSNVTRDANAPVLQGIKSLLPADYTNFGTSYAGYFEGGGDSVAIADGSNALTATGNVATVGTFFTTIGFDGIGAIDLDYGSVDITDHTFTTDGTGQDEIVLPNDSIDDREIDWGAGANQVNAADVPIALGGGSPTVDQVQEYIDNNGSSGFFLGGALSDGGSGTLDVAAGSGFIRTTNDANAELQSFKWSASAGIAVTDDTTQYVYVDDSGVISLSTSEFLETPDKILIGVVTDEGAAIESVFQLGVRLEEGIGQAGRFMRGVHGIARNKRVGGLIFGQSGDANRDVTMTAGQLEWGRTSYTMSAFDTSGADTFTTYSASGQEDATASQWPNAQYDNAGTLTTMTNNRWANLFFWLEPNDKIIMAYGRAEFVSEAGAEAEGVPSSSLPTRITETGLLATRFTFQKSANTADIESAFDTLFANAAVSDHGNLAGLTDDDHDQYILADGTRALAGAWDMGSQATTNVNIDSGVITGITDLAVVDGGTGVGLSTGTIAVVLSNSPTLVTPVLGVATGTSLSLTDGLIVNESGGDFDSRFEGLTNPNLMCLDAGLDLVCIGSSSVQQTISSVTIDLLLSSHSDKGITTDVDFFGDFGFFRHHTGADDLDAPVAFGFKSRGTEASPTGVADDDVLFSMVGGGYDGTASYVPAASIKIVSDGVSGVGDMPGRIEFNTVPDGSTTAIEAMRIDSLQNVNTLGIFSGAKQSSTLGAAATTLAITTNFLVLTGDGGANTIATFTGGVSGQRLTILFVDALVTITDTDAHTADTVDLSAAFTSADDTTLELFYDGISWYEVSRSVN